MPLRGTGEGKLIGSHFLVPRFPQFEMSAPGAVFLFYFLRMPKRLPARLKYNSWKTHAEHVQH